MRRTLIFESRLRKIENEVSKSAVPCSRDSHFREQAPHCLKVRCEIYTVCKGIPIEFWSRLRILESEVLNLHGIKLYSYRVLE